MSEKPWEKMPRIENGTVIDHIPTDRGPFVYLVILPWLKDGITANIRTNIPSQKLGEEGSYGEKWVFKLEEIIDDEKFNNRMAIIGGSEVTINQIKNYEVVRKYHPELPEIVKDDILRCKNPNCITSNDYHAGQRQEFHLVSAEPLVYQCKYCGTNITQKDIDELLKKGF